MRIKFVQNVLDVIRGKKKIKPTLPFLVFWVGTRCTLKCKLCCNLIPYLKQESSNSDEILKDLEFICKNAYIDKFQIQGGEPFTHPDIAKIIDFIGKLNNISSIELATNGTVNLNSEVLEALKRNPKVKVRISNYDCSEKLRAKFIDKLESHGIKSYVYEFVYGNNTWFSTGGINETKEIDDKNAQNTYDLCNEKGCVTYFDGKIYVCGKIPAIQFYYQVKAKNSYDEIDVRLIRKNKKNKQLQQHIKQFYQNYHLFKEECRYCNIDDAKYPAGEQLTGQEVKDIAQNLVEMEKK